MTRTEVLTMIDSQLDRTVKIQGTDYDRKRKYSSKIVKKMNNLLTKGKTISEVAKEFGCNPLTVKYNTDKAFREAFNAKRNGAHTGKDKITVANRVAYKRKLIAQGKLSA